MSQLDAHTVEGLTEIFRVLGDPTRVRILDALSRSELCVGDLAQSARRDRVRGLPSAASASQHPHRPVAP